MTVALWTFEYLNVTVCVYYHLIVDKIWNLVNVYKYRFR
jgi:hypothetical protein